MNAIVTQSKLTCPDCGFSEVLAMPADICLWFHECSACHRLLKPRPGNCCVFCSFGTVPCPSRQAASAGPGPGQS